MSSSSNTEPRITTPQPADPNMNQTSPEDEDEVMLLIQPAQAITQEKLAPPPTSVKPQQRIGSVQPRSSQANPRSSKAQTGETIEKIQKEDTVERVDGVDEDDESLDWVDLEHRYRAALIQVNNAEDSFNERFDSYADAFQIWSQTSAHEDNERAQKRIKTRIAFVQLSEAALEQKRQNYVNVVQAFKTALDLLKHSSSLPMR